MKKQHFLIFLLGLFIFSACGKKKQRILDLEKQLALKTQENETLQSQLTDLQSTKASLLDRMSDLSVISKKGAENISKSLESMTQQYDFIQDLTKKVQSKDSLNLALVMNIKRSLSDINDDDVQVEVRGGVVYVSISDKLLFSSGSSRINSRAREVLGKIAKVINDHDELDIMVEGHTDDQPMSGNCIADNWDLSVKRATSVIRVLQEDYYVDPERLIAAGRAEYLPKAENTTAIGRSLNRRTEIVITPKLDQFFKLMEAPALQN